MFVTIPIQREYEDLANNFYFLLTTILVFHLILSSHYGKKQPCCFGLTGKFLNEDFTMTLGALFLSLLSYKLVFKKLVVFVSI